MISGVRSVAKEGSGVHDMSPGAKAKRGAKLAKGGKLAYGFATGGANLLNMQAKDTSLTSNRK